MNAFLNEIKCLCIRVRVKRGYGRTDGRISGRISGRTDERVKHGYESKTRMRG